MNWPFSSDSRRGPSEFLPRTRGLACSAPRRNSSLPQQGHMTFFSIAMTPFQLACGGTANKCEDTDYVPEVIPATRVWKRIDSVVSEQPTKKAKNDEVSMKQSREEARRIVCSNGRLRGATRKQCRYCADGKQWNESRDRPIHCETPNVEAQGPAACSRSPGTQC